MDEFIVFDRALTKADHVVLQSLAQDIKTVSAARATRFKDQETDCDSGIGSEERPSGGDETKAHAHTDDAKDIAALKATRNPKSATFEPTILMSVDDCGTFLHPSLNKYLLQPYIRLARNIVRHETDVAMLTHLIIYFTTSVPSTLFLFRRFTYTHAILHFIMQMYYVGTYTLMQHQHIHQRGILANKYAFFDTAFPYILDPLMGHTWNSYYYHHVKHHHVEGNGPDDLSTTIRYRRDSVVDFLRYVGRFFFLVWLDLPLYFLGKNRYSMAFKAAGSEFSTYTFYYLVSRVVGTQPTVFVYILPLIMLRMGLMVGNWGQHAFVDSDEPVSDFRSSITVVDVASNRFCFNDGYHTSHHLNPLRHWRDHPISFLEQKQTYANEGALVFHNIDFLMITFRLLCKDYEHLAKCLVPMGNQINLTMDGRVELLKRMTKKFSEEEIAQKFRKTD
ncbi:fatty acid desaturase [Metarhizium rileyi]|uniref:Fatty acid desaturase n=1 Tax=Metarhizium rileyi (strain RCEF 4871) TaxID=1649241 RepID=A0A162JP44_METRR|nr:fatty acid desaturase [Metarhizium rileyi RCEF 4871]